ncbi:MAG: SMP-30/gluconolactonase/LRE family protein [Gammaproteobacteria bacterium]|nr:SMP-30/gluconolactonase/LRE family protein [Gammaproteobacteria bacterium]MBU1444081.1 SMP-30/gluconolactonase/LRE family protein [Gammaproteobacteria bacterium]
MNPTPDSLPAPSAIGELHCLWDAGAQLGEGALWSPSLQALWWVDILGCRLHRFRPADDARDSWSFDEEVSAVAEVQGSRSLLLTLRRGFALFDPDSGAPPVYQHRPDGEPASNRFNDGKCDLRGRFWGGTMDFDCVAPTGALYRFDPDGRCTRHDTGFAVTNGPTWSADGRTMYFNDTVRGTVLAYDFDRDRGEISGRRSWLRFAKGDGFPDGMTTDAAGRIWIAHWGAACVSCHDPVTAAELYRIHLPAKQITSCAFGGADLRTLFVTSAATGLDSAQREAQPLAGALFSVELDASGVPANLFGH